MAELAAQQMSANGSIETETSDLSPPLSPNSPPNSPKDLQQTGSPRIHAPLQRPKPVPRNKRKVETAAVTSPNNKRIKIGPDGKRIIRSRVPLSLTEFR
jgi:hypothetical protein